MSLLLVGPLDGWVDEEGGLAWIVDWLPELGASLLGVIFAATILRAISQSGRYRATGVLGESEQRELEDELEQAESRTTGEIIIVVLERSDRHPAAHWVAGVMTLLLGTAASAPWMPWDQPVLFFALQLAWGCIGALAALLIPGFRRHFVTEERASETAEEQAFQEFYRYRLHRTKEQTGVLIFVSLFERRVIVLGDEGIDAVLDASHWEETDAAVLEGILGGDLKGGLHKAIERCTDVLARHFPAEGENPNEVPNHVIVRAE
jgi:putative membrane protein